MNRPTRADTAGRVYLDLRALARRTGRPTDEMILLYVLERFLYRLSQSAHREALILKGGMLLAALDQRRPTRDIDLLALDLDNDAAAVAALVRDVLAVEADDGVTFEHAALTSAVIRENNIYPGIRVSVPAAVHRARHPLRIDVNVGDPVTPAPTTITFPALLGDAFPLRGYPIETVLAEKIVTMIERGGTTTRERDFADVYTLILRHNIDAQTLRTAVTATAAHRNAQLRPLVEAVGALASTGQDRWTAFLSRNPPGHGLPSSYEAAITAVIAFADPLLRGNVTAGTWHAEHTHWG